MAFSPRVAGLVLVLVVTLPPVTGGICDENFATRVEIFIVLTLGPLPFEIRRFATIGTAVSRRMVKMTVVMVVSASLVAYVTAGHRDDTFFQFVCLDPASYFSHQASLVQNFVKLLNI